MTKRTKADIDAEKASYRKATRAVFRGMVREAIERAMHDTGYSSCGMELVDFDLVFKMDQKTLDGKYVGSPKQRIRMNDDKA